MKLNDSHPKWAKGPKAVFGDDLNVFQIIAHGFVSRIVGKFKQREVRTMSSKISRRQFLRTSAVVAGGAAMMATPVKHAHSQTVIKWRGQTCFPSTVAPFGPFKQGETGLFASLKQWCEWLSKRTNGRLVIDWAEPGAIVPIVEADKAVAQGTIRISYGLNSYYAGRIPETDIETGGIFFWEDESQCYECLHSIACLSCCKIPMSNMVSTGCLFMSTPWWE